MSQQVTDAERFREVYEQHYDAVHAFACRRMRDRSLAADVTAEVFLVAWRRLDDLPEPPAPWLFGVARRVIMATNRTSPPLCALLDDQAHGLRWDLGIAEQYERREELRLVARAMDALTESDRELLLLVTWENLTLVELSVALECSRTAAAVRLHRARRRLRGHLERPPAAVDSPRAIPTVTGETP